MESGDIEESQPAASRRFSPRASAVALLLSLAIIPPAILAWFQWRHFRQELNLLDIRPWTWPDLPLVWLEYATTQVVLLPALLLSLACIFFRRPRIGLAIFLAWLFIVFVWLQADERVFTMTHIHLLAYRQFLGDPTAAQWAGDTTGANALALLAASSPLVLPVLVAVALIFLTVMRARKVFAPFWQRKFAATLAIAYVLSLIAVAPAQRLFYAPHDLQRLHAMLPIDMTWSAVGMRLVDVAAFSDPLNARLRPALRCDLPILNSALPLDTTTRVVAGPKPNVLLLVIESLREDAMVPSIMPRLCKISAQGTRLVDHFAGSRMSHLGMFNLLFGRTSAMYYMTLAEGKVVIPQACITLKASGYTSTYTASADHRAWLRMGQFISERTFDQMNLFHAKSWLTRDERTLACAKGVLDAAADHPRFVVAFVASTHFPYAYPPQYATRQPTLNSHFIVARLRPEKDAIALRNRYHNACSFMDAQIADFLATIDLSKTLVIITGDHGESLFDDGAVAHGGRWSDAELRVPCFFLGAGIHPAIVTAPTTHTDILPTLLHVIAGKTVPLQGITGRDVLASTPAPEFTLIGANSVETDFEMLIAHGDRRMLFEFSPTSDHAIVRGLVDQEGEIDPYNLPAVGTIPKWSGEISHVFDQLAETHIGSPGMPLPSRVSSIAH